MEVAIASFTRYPKAVEYVVQNHLGLSKEQAESIKVVGGMDRSFESSDSKIRKNLHILYLLKKYKSEHKGQLPQEVMLVDDSQENVDSVNDFHNNIGALLAQEKNISSILKNIDEEVAETTITKEELQSINFTGVQVPEDPITEISEDKQKEHYDYLDQAEKWVKKKKVRFEDTSNARQHNKPQPWKKCAVIIAPLVIGLLIGGLTFSALPLAESPLLIAAMSAVVTIVAAYVLEEIFFKPELKPSSVLKESGEKVNNLFAKKEKTQVVQ